MSCDLAHTNICKVDNCIIQVDGMESNSLHHQPIHGF